MLAKKVFISKKTQQKLGAKYPTVEDALNVISPGIASYLTFVSGRTGDELDAAFGKNNEDYAIGIGTALARYAKFKEFDGSFEALSTCSSANDIINNSNAIGEMLNSSDLLSFITISEFASNFYMFTIHGSNEGTNANGGILTYEHDLVITQAHLDGTIPIYLEYEMYGGIYASWNLQAYLYLNDVVIQYANKDHQSSDMWYRDYFKLNLADYNITTPGTYSLKSSTDVGSCSVHSKVYYTLITGKA